MSIKAYPRRSPPDGKSPPPSTADTSVVIPGFISKSRDITLAVPLPAPMLLSKMPNSTQAYYCKPLGKQMSATKKPIQIPVRDNGVTCVKRKENTQPSAWRSSLGHTHGRVKDTPANWTVKVHNTRHSELALKSSANPVSLESPKPAPRTKINSRVTAKPKPAPRLSTKRNTSQTDIGKHPIPVSRPVISPGQRGFVATPVSSTIHKSGTAIHVSQKCPQAPHLLLSQGTSRPESLPLETLSPTDSVKSPNFCSDLEKGSSSEIAPYFIQPLNLCDPFLDNLGLAEICSLRVDELQYLTHTSHNKPVTLSDGRTKPSFLVRLWSRGSGKYLNMLSVGELYGRGIFGQSEPFRLILDGPRTVILQSARDSNLHVTMDHWTVTGKGIGGRECQFLIHQGPTGYCLLESLHSPGSFLGVRRNGNIMKPASVTYNCTEAKFVIQKQSMAAL